MLDAVSESETWEVARIRAAVSAVLEGIRKSFFCQTGPSPEEAGLGVADGCSHCTRGLRASAEDMRSNLVQSHGDQLRLGRAESRAWPALPHAACQLVRRGTAEEGERQGGTAAVDGTENADIN